MMKLSKTQIKVLKQLQNKDDAIRCRTAFGFHVYFNSNWETVSLATLSVLRRNSLLKCVEKNWASALYRISEKGKRILKESEQK